MACVFESHSQYLFVVVDGWPELVNPGFCEVSVNYKNITKLLQIVDFGKVRKKYKTIQNNYGCQNGPWTKYSEITK